MTEVPSISSSRDEGLQMSLLIAIQREINQRIRYTRHPNSLALHYFSFSISHGEFGRSAGTSSHAPMDDARKDLIWSPFSMDSYRLSQIFPHDTK